MVMKDEPACSGVQYVVAVIVERSAVATQLPFLVPSYHLMMYSYYDASARPDLITQLHAYQTERRFPCLGIFRLKASQPDDKGMAMMEFNSITAST